MNYQEVNHDGRKSYISREYQGRIYHTAGPVGVALQVDARYPPFHRTLFPGDSFLCGMGSILLRILFTGKYPKGLFDFNVGVMRWSWRVGFYSYSALGTDKYPPFAMEPIPGYPADLDVAYPEKLSHGLVLVKWWLLAIPHWIIIEIFRDLIPILVFVAGICLLFTGNYPKDLFKLVIGFNRWTVRVMAYVSLMRDEYPPFRLWDD
jgi:hypothetical protein